MTKVESIIAIYLVGANIAGFLLMGLDKWKAKNKRWRVAEKTLFGVSLLGGSVGTWVGMYAFRHKTRHWHFVVGMPLILAVQVAAALFLLFL